MAELLRLSRQGRGDPQGSQGVSYKGQRCSSEYHGQGHKAQKTQGATESQLKSLAERVMKASADFKKAMTLVKAAEEECALAIEKHFKFYGSNLSQSKQASWEKIM